MIEALCRIDFEPDIIHCNDWQTALIPIYLQEDRYRIPQLSHAKSVFTIHNIEYQGRFGREVLEDVLGLNAGYFTVDMLAHQNDINLMKGAIICSDYVTTVSPSYAGELRDPFYAHGLDGVIAANAHKLRGILNGIDTKLYDPATMPGITRPFTARAPVTGKKA